jgi:MYXO-CTERM domain-containing protein
MTRHAWVVGSFIPVVLLGCAKEGDIAIDATASDFAKAICPKAYDCCTTDELKGNAAAGASESECETNTAGNIRNQLLAIQAAQSAGRATFDKAQVDACLAALRQATCPELATMHSLAGLAACDATFAVPRVGLGGACQNDFECQASICQKSTGASAGACAAGAPAGAACPSDRCAPGLLCDPRNGSDPADDVCVAEQESGMACLDNFECKSRYCAASGDAGTKRCAPSPTPQCFYGGGCAVGGGHPGSYALVIAGVGALLAIRRTRRRTR